MKIKTYLSIILIGLFFCVCKKTQAQAPDWEWARGAGGNNLDLAFGVQSDKSGNVYAVGTYQSPAISFGTFNFTSGVASIFIVKYNSSGNVIWAKSIGGIANYTKGANSVCIDPSGNFYITGYFGGSMISFDNDTLFANAGGTSSFVVKYDSSGSVLWAKSILGYGNFTGYPIGMGVINDSNGNVLVTGSFSGDSLLLDSFIIANPNVGCGSDIFIAKYDSSGNLLWAKRAGGYGSDQANSICTDAKGNAYITGYVRSSGTIDFDSISVTLASTTDRIFTAKYNAAGQAQWVRYAGYSWLDEGESITADDDGNVYVTGLDAYNPSITFDTIVLSCYGGKDLFIVKYDSLGNVCWAKNAGGSADDAGYGVSIDTLGNLFLTGYTGSPLFIIEPDTLQFNTNGLFVIKYNNSGNIVWVREAHTSTPCGVIPFISMSNCVNETLYLAGSFASDSIAFGSSILFNDSICNNNIFIAKLGAAPAGINDAHFKAENTVSIYPNPVHDVLTVSLNYHLPVRSIISITDMQGRIVKEISPLHGSPDSYREAGGEVINVSALSQGVYLLKLNGQVQRFVKM